MLWIIGKSKTPLSSYQIKIHMQESTYVYKVIKEKLAPIKYSRNEHLFNLDDISKKSNDVYYKLDLVKKLNSIFGLNWKIEEKKDIVDLQYYNDIIKCDRSDDGQFITISYGSNNLVAIKLSQAANQQDTPNVIIISNGKKEIRTLTLEKDRFGKLGIYTRKYNSETIRYLKVTLSDRAREKISKIEKEYQRNLLNCRKINAIDLLQEEEKTLSKTLKIKNDTEYWRYSLNLRGFLLYLVEDSQTERKNSRRIRSVISNPAIVQEAPFLMYWQDFEKAGFNVIGLLKKIGTEFQNQLQFDNDCLLRRVTERYYIELTNYFYSLESPTFFP